MYATVSRLWRTVRVCEPGLADKGSERGHASQFTGTSSETEETHPQCPTEGPRAHPGTPSFIQPPPAGSRSRQGSAAAAPMVTLTDSQRGHDIALPPGVSLPAPLSCKRTEHIA